MGAAAIRVHPGEERMNELVLVVPRAELRGGLGWRGVRSDELERQLEVIARAGTFRARGDVEEDPSWKQVIPYLVLRDGALLFLMQRTRSGGDARLHERYSIGVGGHLNPGDGDVLGGLRREWREELAAEFEPEFELLGLLNDDEDPVGAVHLGLVYLADARGRQVSVRETDKLRGSFATRREVQRVYDDLETWSRLVFDFLENRAG
ncbi:MAG: NUDIX domain-containing protein [Chloroflexota bacterium]|nr:NUDIX domain-containing protein [Chloroflexota bacterium]